MDLIVYVMFGLPIW